MASINVRVGDYACVSHWAGRVLTVEASPDDTVYKVKEMVESLEALPPSGQHMCCQGRILANESTLAECGIVEEDTTIHLILMLRPQ